MDSNTWTFFGIALIVFGVLGYLEYRAGYRTGKQATRYYLLMLLCTTLGVAVGDLVTDRFGYAWGAAILAPILLALFLGQRWWRRRQAAAEPAQEDSLNSAPRSQE